VDNAKRIEAYAESKSPTGGGAGSKILIEQGSLKGYSNQAGVLKGTLYSRQNFSVAKGDVVKAVSWGLDGTRDTRADLTVTQGQLINYVDKSYIQKHSGKDIMQTKQIGFIDISPGKGNFRSVTTSDYTYEDEIDGVVRSGHYESVRTPNYGTSYVVIANATSDFSDANYKKSIVRGNLVYFVNVSNPQFNRIQGAVDAAQDNDFIKVAPGKYSESLVLDKNLSIQGSGAGNTTIEGQGGSVVWIRNSSAFVYLDSLAITNGHAKMGGGIHNDGYLILDKCSIYSNYAEKGGAIYNDNTLLIMGGQIGQNIAKNGGGGVWNLGFFNMSGGDIYSNSAKNGGGVYNDGIFIMDGGCITGNNAKDGGAVYNDESFTINRGSISGNVASGRGGAVYNNHALVQLNGGNIFGNSAKKNGGINDEYTFKKGVKGDQSVVHNNRNGNIGYHWFGGRSIGFIFGVALLVAVVVATSIFCWWLYAGASAVAAGGAGAAVAAAIPTFVEIATTALLWAASTFFAIAFFLCIALWSY
jgi:hypothetical protein